MRSWFVPMPLIRAPSVVEEAAQALDVRLAGRVQDHGLALGQHRGHHRVLGAGHAHLVEEDLGAAEAAVERQVERRAGRDARAQLAQREQVGVEPPPPDPVAAGRRQHGLARPREQPRRQQHRAAELRHHRGVGVAALEVARVQAHRAVVVHVHPHAQVAEPFEQRGHVPDAGHVVDHYLARDEQAGREHGQGLVLVAGRRHRPPQGMAALHQEAISGHVSLLVNTNRARGH